MLRSLVVLVLVQFTLFVSIAPAAPVHWSPERLGGSLLQMAEKQAHIRAPVPRFTDPADRIMAQKAVFIQSLAPAPPLWALSPAMADAVAQKAEGLAAALPAQSGGVSWWSASGWPAQPCTAPIGCCAWSWPRWACGRP